jgi:hypothetical protein
VPAQRVRFCLLGFATGEAYPLFTAQAKFTATPATIPQNRSRCVIFEKHRTPIPNWGYSPWEKSLDSYFCNSGANRTNEVNKELNGFFSSQARNFAQENTSQGWYFLHKKSTGKQDLFIV